MRAVVVDRWMEPSDLKVSEVPDPAIMPGAMRIDVLTLYDPFTIVALIQIEDMGFCAKGEAGDFVAGGALDFDGSDRDHRVTSENLSHNGIESRPHFSKRGLRIRGVKQ